MMDFDYNTTRPHLILSEYGRNVQNMVKYVINLPDREQRNKYAMAVIDLMGFLNPHLRDVADFKHKLWDHLYIISNYAIDVDCPYETPVPESRERKPKHLGYPQQRIKYKHYGKAVEDFIQQAVDEQDPAKREQMVVDIANFMKMAYVNWNKDSVSDEVILRDLALISGGKLTVSESVNLQNVEARSTQPAQNFKNKKGKNKKNNKQKQRF